MRRVSEGFLVGEIRLREALMSLPGLAGFGSTGSRPKIPVNPPLKKICLERTSELTGIALRVNGNGPHNSTVRNHAIRIAKHIELPSQRMGQRANYTRHALLPWAAEKFTAEAKAACFRPIFAEGRP